MIPAARWAEPPLPTPLSLSWTRCRRGGTLQQGCVDRNYADDACEYLMLRAWQEVWVQSGKDEKPAAPHPINTLVQSGEVKARV